jgi:GNAT superfamily N-acetyltransferase
VILTIRDLDARDEVRWRELWAGYLDFYEHPLPEAVTAGTLRRLLAGEDGMAALVAVDDDDQPVAFAHTVLHAGTWDLGPRCYLEDLYAAPEVRGTGVGRALIEAVRERARQAGAVELYWITATDNATARRLYDRVATLSGFVRYEIDLR